MIENYCKIREKSKFLPDFRAFLLQKTANRPFAEFHSCFSVTSENVRKRSGNLTKYYCKIREKSKFLLDFRAFLLQKAANRPFAEFHSCFNVISENVRKRSGDLTENYCKIREQSKFLLDFRAFLLQKTANHPFAEFHSCFNVISESVLSRRLTSFSLLNTDGENLIVPPSMVSIFLCASGAQ